MPLERFGLLTARLLDRKPATEQTGHYQLLCGAGDERWRIAVNARSALAPSEVAYAVLDAFSHPLLAELEPLAEGWTDRAGLDYIRGNLCQPEQFRPLPLSAAGPDNDLNDLFDFHLLPLAGNADARVYAFGQAWGPETEPDRYFGFTPGRGVHDIHQNQGNVGRFVSDDGVWQDGGLLTRSATGWTAILLRFQSQSWHTDDRTGHAIGGGEEESALRIVAAAVNPPGPAPEPERLHVVNRTYEAVELAGWRLATDAGQGALEGVAPPASVVELAVPATAPLSNRGGRITLLDPDGLKAHGVAYGADDAAREDRLVVFG
jgi:uncharacterized protein YukJ